MQPKIHRGKMTAEGFRYAIVVSRWNDFLTSKLVDGALDAFESHGVFEEDVEIFKVPGSFELPLTCKKVAESGDFDAVIAVGVVIRGETPHFDYVAGEAASGISRASMETGVPVLFSVVTANTLEQAINRAGVKSGNKGYEAALSAIEIVSLYDEIDSPQERSQKMTQNNGAAQVPAWRKEKVFPHVV